MRFLKIVRVRHIFKYLRGQNYIKKSDSRLLIYIYFFLLCNHLAACLINLLATLDSRESRGFVSSQNYPLIIFVLSLSNSISSISNLTPPPP